MEIYVIRHTTPDVAKGICYGQTDLKVAATFWDEVKTIHAQIPLSEIDKVISSPLQRCLKLANTFDSPIHIEARLQEVNFGDWEMKAWNEIPANMLDPWMKDFVNVAPPNGESYVVVQQRVLACFKEILQLPAKKIVICTHATPIRILLSSLQQMALKDSFQNKVAYGQVFKIGYLHQKLEWLPDYI